MGLKLPEPFGTEPLTTHRVVVKDSTADLKDYPNLYETGSEPLEAEELRVTALGSGYPARRGQAAAGFLVELGNGEVFIFDAGAGTNSAFHHMRVPYSKATKFFITHYHIDHIADLIVYYDFGQSNGRLEPMHLHGPAGEKPELGMNALVENIYRMAAWHDRTKLGNLDPRGFDMEPHEFVPDQAKTVYDENGVLVRAFPVPHGIYGAVGYRLDYAGMSVVYAGDCEPSTLTVENSQNADVIIHETFNPPHTYVDMMDWPETQAKIVAWTKHTAPEAVAEVFSRTKPSLAMVFHFLNYYGTPQPLLDAIRTGYDGPVVLAQDFTVVNVTPEQIVTRMVKPEAAPLLVADHEYQARMNPQPDPSVMHGLPEWLEDTIIPIDFIEEFKKELEEGGAR